jgi:hypothetical protein
VFTAISGSAGAQLRFSTAAPARLAADPEEFVRCLQQVNIPPDSLFTVRFGGETWHQFVPLHRNSAHPALFALSCHTNELGGELPQALRERIAANAPTFLRLTEVLPEPAGTARRTDAPRAANGSPVAARESDFMAGADVRLDARPRRPDARGRGAAAPAPVPGRRILADNGGGREVTALASAPPDSLLLTQLDGEFNHEDSFRLRLAPGEVATRSAQPCCRRCSKDSSRNRPLGVSR